jgi:hypothetical protein
MDSDRLTPIHPSLHQLRSIKWDQFRTVFEELLDLISASEIEDVTPRIDIDRVEIYLDALS